MHIYSFLMRERDRQNILVQYTYSLSLLINLKNMLKFKFFILRIRILTTLALLLVCYFFVPFSSIFTTIYEKFYPKPKPPPPHWAFIYLHNAWDAITEIMPFLKNL